MSSSERRPQENPRRLGIKKNRWNGTASWAEVFDHDIGNPEQFPGNLNARFILEIDADTLLSTVSLKIVSTLLVLTT